MNFPEAVKSGLRNYSNAYGRASRSEYWYWQLFYVTGILFLSFIDDTVLKIKPPGDVKYLNILSAIFGLGLMAPSINMGVRRLHDSDRSGWWFLIVFAPYINILAIIIIGCLKGTVEHNRFDNIPEKKQPNVRWPFIAVLILALLSPVILIGGVILYKKIMH